MACSLNLRSQLISLHVSIALYCFTVVAGISLEENGPRFMDDWISSVKFSSRVGGKLYCRTHGTPKPIIQWFTSESKPVTNITNLREVTFFVFFSALPFALHCRCIAYYVDLLWTCPEKSTSRRITERLRIYTCVNFI